MKTTHQLAAELLKCENVPVTISIDVSTGDDDAGHRAFSLEYLGINDKRASQITLLFDGIANYQ